MTVSRLAVPFISLGLTITTADVGAYSYGLTHPMKPQRMRITHELLSAYNILPKMQVLVSRLSREIWSLAHDPREQNAQHRRP